MRQPTRTPDTMPQSAINPMPQHSLDSWLEKIAAMNPNKIELGLERIAEVADSLAIRKLAGKVITVAGTNGKGSTVALLDALLRGMGFSTSVYTSPHLFRFTERIQQNGSEVSETALAAAFEKVDLARANGYLTYFEFTTLAALLLFQQKPTDFIILEVGLGGRLDAVNLVDADVAVITSIGLDHTALLGSTREAIAIEKAGIARADRPLLYGELDMPATISQIATDKRAQLLRAGDSFSSTNNQLSWQKGQLLLSAPALLGNDNLATALAALACLECSPDARLVRQVAASTQLPGRCELWVVDDVEWVFDVGHNHEAIARFSQRLSAMEPKPTLVLAAMLTDKPADALLLLLPLADRWFVANLPGPRGGGVERFTTLLPQAQQFLSVAEALQELQQVVEPGDRVVISGSFMTVMEVQSLLYRGQANVTG